MLQMKTLAVGVTMTIACVSVFAQAASTPLADKREALQAKRIQQGTSSGQLTTREANRLDKEQELIGKAEDKAKADGTVTNKERLAIHRMQKRASRDTARQMHDRQTAASAP
jgi:hypothetical protein